MKHDISSEFSSIHDTTLLHSSYYKHCVDVGDEMEKKNYIKPLIIGKQSLMENRNKYSIKQIYDIQEIIVALKKKWDDTIIE